MNLPRFVVHAVFCAISSLSVTGAEPLPEWCELKGSQSFRLPLKPEEELSEARLRVTTDFASLTIRWKGQVMARLEPYDPVKEIDLRPWLRSGPGELLLETQALPGAPAALAARVVLAGAGGANRRTFSTGMPGWLVEGAPPALGRIDPRRWGLGQLPEVSPFAEYNQWKEAFSTDGKDTASGARLSPLPPGFRIELVRTARPEEDSWVSLAIDPRGRLIVAREQRGLLRLTLADGGREVAAVEVIDDTLRECRGLAWQGDSLFAQANNTKGLYRLRDTDGDDRFDEILLLQATSGGVGHGRNDLASAPDGSLHAITGDDVLVPEGALRRTLPERGAPLELGHWVRMNHAAAPGGQNWEILARGLRNPYGIDFNSDGEAFTYDADNEGDIGLPFYRPTRVNHLVSGANYGWHQDRGNTRSLPVWAPDSVPTTFDVGRGSPTGVKFGTRSSFPSPWREAFFALDWAYGRIVAAHLVPRGASYQGSGEVFLEGRPLNVTDLGFDAGGNLWFITGGRKTQSALYRVSWDAEETAFPGPGAQDLKRSAYSHERRAERHRLEAFHGRREAKAVEAAWTFLGDSDPWLRHAARVALEWQPVESWRDLALSSDSSLQGLTAKLALARTGHADDRIKAWEESSGAPPGKEATRTGKLTWLRIAELAETSAGPVQAVESWLPDVDAEVNREATRRLAAWSAPSAVDWSLRFLGEARDQGESLHYLEVLSEASTGWDPARRRAYFRGLAQAKRFSNGDRFLPAFFQEAEKKALSHAPASERAELAKLLTPEAAGAGAVEKPKAPRPFVRHWTLADFEDGAADALSESDSALGRQLFQAVLCAKCHMCGTEGLPVGPDLTTVASRFSRRDLLESIIEPSNVVSEVHRNVHIKRGDGTEVLGRIVQDDFRKSLLQVSQNPFVPEQLTEVAKQDIVSWEESPVSPMPPALLDTLSRDEILALLRWIENGGK